MVQFRDIDLPTGVPLRVNNGDLIIPSNNILVGGVISGNTIIEGGVSLPSKYLGITAKATNSDKLDNLDSTQFVRADIDFVATGTIRAKAIGNDTNGTYIPFPNGGSIQTNQVSIAGAIKITLPQSWTNTMLRFAVDVYNYATNESFTIYIGGYNYSATPSWMSTTAYIVGNSISRDFSIRFGHDGTRCCVYIGELNSAWTYPQVVVRDFFAGYGGNTFTSWSDGWAVGFTTTTFGAVTSTISDCLVKSSYSKNSMQLNGQDASYYAVATHSHGDIYLPATGKAADSKMLDGVDSSRFVRNDIANSIAGLVTITTGGLKVNSGGIVSNTIQYGTMSTGMLNDESGAITLEALSPNTSVNIKSTGTGLVKANGSTIYTSSNLVISDFVKNNAGGQQVTGDFSIAGTSTLFIGTTGTNSGSLIVKGDGANKIQIAGTNAVKDSAATVYINAIGDAQFSGTVTVNKLAVINSAMVSSLNAEMLAGKKELDFAKTASIVESSGYGVHSGLIVSAQTIPNLSVRIAAGVVYTDTGRRYEIIQTDQAITPASTTYGRWDTVFIYGSKNATGGSSGALEGTIGYKEGTASATPSDPVIPAGAVKLARIVLVASQGTIQAAHINNIIEWKHLTYDGAGFHVRRQPLSIESSITSDATTVAIAKPIKGTAWAKSNSIPAGSRSVVWNHNLGLGTAYVIELSSNSPNRHVYWENKASNSITLWIDDMTDVAVIVDAVITAV